jgi:hypothetical protein
MKVNRIIALRLMLSVAVIIGFASCSKNQVQKCVKSYWNVDSKASGNKKQVAGPGLIFVEGGIRWVKYRTM